jgi:hypothetical protein
MAIKICKPSKNEGISKTKNVLKMDKIPEEAKDYSQKVEEVAFIQYYKGNKINILV